MTARKQFLGFLGWLVVAFAAAAVGAVASVRAGEFYQTLDRPAWAPPAAVFSPVWTCLYLCMAVASWLVWREPTLRRRPALVIYMTQLALNALWSWLFFAWHQGMWACVEIVVLWVLIGATVVRFWRIRRAAAALLMPYWLWVSFASVLAFAVWRRNPALL